MKSLRNTDWWRTYSLLALLHSH